MADQATSRHQPVVIRPWRSSMLQPDAYVRSGSGADKPPLGQGGGVQRVPSVESGSGQRLAGAGTPGVRPHRMTPNGVGVSAPFPLIHATRPPEAPPPAAFANQAGMLGKSPDSYRAGGAALVAAGVER